MFDFIAIPFGYLMRFCYMIFDNYGLAIILFTLITKIVLFPLSLKQHKSTVKMQLFQPKIDKLKKMYGNNQQKLQEEQMKLYADEGYNPMSSCLPLFIQMPILLGLYNVIRNPLKYIAGVSKEVIAKGIEIMQNNQDKFAFLTGKTEGEFGVYGETYLINAVSENSEVFKDLNTISPDVVNKISDFDYTFLGLDMGALPSAGGILLLIPIFSFIFNLLYSVYMQHRAKMARGKNAPKQPGGNFLLFFTPIFSTFIAFTVPAGLGVYWIWSTVFMFLQSLLLYKFYTSEKVEKSIEKDKEKRAEKRKTRPSFYERALEAQKMQNEQLNVNKDVKISSEDAKLSKSEMKDFQRRTLNEARRRMAEKYGDEFTEE